MKILIYGAGVLGCNLAHDFYRAGKDVTILARGKWAEQIRNHGLVIKHIMSKTVDKIKVVEALEKENDYNIIFVVMQYSQLEAVIPYLQNSNSKNIVFVGNNMDTKKYEEKLRGKSVWFGFSSSAGKREEKYVKSISLHKMIIGSAFGECRGTEFLQKVFSGSKIKVTIMGDMDEWLKTHISFILPLAGACYAYDGNLKKIKHDATAINRIIDEMKDNYDGLLSKGYKIVPYSEYEYVTKKRLKCYKFIKLMCATRLGKIAICDHSMAAKDEMHQLQEALSKLISEQP